METPSLALYLVTSFVVVVAPGPGMLYVISRGLAAGKRAGVLAALGTSTGIAAHIAATALGVTAVLQVSEIGFQIMKWLGVAYLIFLAWEALILKTAFNPQAPTSPAASSVFWKGTLVNALNPKVAFFFFAFLPQFVSPGRGDVPAQMFVLGAVFLLLTAIVFTLYGLSSAAIRTHIIERPRVRRLLEAATGSLFLFLGFRLALASRE
jgi:threonine/homoserine/homoserine lactone efflux protein